MNTCIVCGKEVHGDDGYATDGKIFVCRKCAEIQTLRTITVHIGNSGVDSNLVYKREAPIEMESGLVNQTDEVESSLVNQTASPHVELDKAYIDERDGSTIPNGCSKDCPYYPYDTCGHYYGEIHECMLEEENSIPKAEIVPAEEYEGEIEADIENMSEDDFMSKYCDNPQALNAWMDAHSDDPAFTNI